MIDDSAIRLRFRSLDPVLDERGRRRFAAAEALAAGYGGILAVSRETGIARSTIQRGLTELSDEADLAVPPERVRRAGGGRKSMSATDTTLVNDLQSLVDPVTRGDPMAPLLWTSKSLRRLAAELQALGHRIGHNVVAKLLREQGYSLQANCKTLEGASHPNRDAQSNYINDQAKAALAADQPAISVDTKKEGAGWRLQEQRPRISPQRRSGKGPGAQYQDPRGWPRRAIRGLRHCRRCLLGQRRVSTMTRPALPAVRSATGGKLWDTSAIPNPGG